MLKKIMIPVVALILIGAGKDTTISFNGKELENSLAYIPMTSANYPPGDMKLPTPTYSGNQSKTFSENAFYISKYEVSNGQYLIYLRDLLSNGKKDEYLAALPDTSLWNEAIRVNDIYRGNYFRHPAYRDYPVVGVSYDQSIKYCDWLTQKYGKEIKKKYANAVFKLPTVKQWYVAACGGQVLCDYPWGGPYLKNKKGEYFANFSVIQERCVYRDEKTGELKVAGWLGLSADNRMGLSGAYNNRADVTASVFSYSPNDYGLHNMAGNVEEFVLEKGITKGGSWRDPAYYLQNFVEEKYDTLRSASLERGFRFVMEISK